MNIKTLTLCTISLALASGEKVFGSHAELLAFQEHESYHKSNPHNLNSTIFERKEPLPEKPMELRDYILNNSYCDADDIDDKSDVLYRKGDLDGAARAFVAAAIFGITDNQNDLYQIDQDTLKYIQNKEYEKLELVCQKLRKSWERIL